MLTFAQQLTALGFASYKDYLLGPHWQDFRHRYRTSSLPQRCAVCKSVAIQLHHHTYERLGAELLSDVTPLCRKHHDAVHALLTKSYRPLADTAWAVSILSTNSPPVKRMTPKQAKAFRKKKRQRK